MKHDLLDKMFERQIELEILIPANETIRWIVLSKWN
jgi:hypothetical protein